MDIGEDLLREIIEHYTTIYPLSIPSHSIKKKNTQAAKVKFEMSTS
jgi:hypothetical protein